MTDAPNIPGDENQRWIGQVLDSRYQIRELLGEGGMGAVFAAEHLSLRKQVALKMIRAEFAGNEEIAARFTREAMATAQLDHPNVASALDYGALPGGGAYLVTQLVRGRSLESHRAAGRMPWRQVCDLGAQIADALSAAHAIHIVHRDLKPDNILLEPRDDGTFLVKVLDFGVARITSGAPLPGGDLTRMGTVIGTPGYMAPEQAMGESVDFRVDIYALGVILWECIAGKVLWDGESVSDLFTRQLADPAPSLGTLVPGMPPEISALVDLMLDRQPKRRPESARQVRDALRRMSHGTLIVPPTTAAIAAPPPARKVSRGLVLAALGGLLVVGAVALLGRGGEPPVIAGEVAGAPADPAPAPAASAAAEVPPELAGPVEILTSVNDRSERKKAAETVLAHTPQDSVALYARNLAWLEKASNCDNKKAVIKKIAEAGDPRALPGLLLLSKSPRKGCGAFNAQDCHGCLRELLAKTIEQLRPAGAAP